MDLVISPIDKPRPTFHPLQNIGQMLRWREHGLMYPTPRMLLEMFPKSLRRADVLGDNDFNASKSIKQLCLHPYRSHELMAVVRNGEDKVTRIYSSD